MTTYEPQPSNLPIIPSNIASQLPSVNFGFEELKERMAKFTVQFDEFIEKRREKMLEDKNAFIRDIAEVKETQRSHKRNIEYYKQKEKEVEMNAEKDDQEIGEVEREISTISAQKASKETTRDALTAQITTVRSAIAKKRALLSKEKSELAAQATHNQPELAFWEDYLGLRIEGAGRADHIRFVFTCLDDVELDREFEVVLNIERREYEIVGTRPKLEREVVEGCVDRLNETRNIPKFLKEVREAFVNSYVKH